MSNGLESEELSEILTNSNYTKFLNVKDVQENFYRKQINGVIYFRPKNPEKEDEHLEKFEV